MLVTLFYFSSCCLKVIFHNIYDCCFLVGEISLAVQVDDSSTWYADGITVGSTSNWRIRSTFSISASTQLLAVEAYSAVSACGIFAELSSGIVADTSWRCLADAPSSDSWKANPDFDDSSWLNAVGVDGARIDGDTIWASGGCSQNAFAFCRVRLR